jgi:DNA-binding MarR family transcriptional regulator
LSDPVTRRPVIGTLDRESQRDLQVLEAVAGNERITQRTLARRLGIAVGLTNLYLKRLARKGFIKFVNVRPNRIVYLVTPKGIAEKTRLTYEFMDYSLFLYRNVRQHLHVVLQPYAAGERTRIAVYGTGEAAELAYLSITELGLELVAVFDGVASGRFLGRPIRAIQDHHEVPFDLLLVATLERSEPIVEDLVRLGIQRGRLVTLRQ